MHKIATSMLLVWLAACTTPRAGPAPAAADPKGAPEFAVAASAPAATPSSVAASAATPSSAGAPAAGVVNQNYVKRGYRAVHRNGQLLYCQSQIVTGSLFHDTVCLTEDQMRASDRKTQNTVDEFVKMRNATGCTGPKCN